MAKDEPILWHNYDIRPSVKLHFQNLWQWRELYLWEDVHSEATPSFPTYSLGVAEFPWGRLKPNQIEWMEVFLRVIPSMANCLGGDARCLSTNSSTSIVLPPMMTSSGLPRSPKSNLHLAAWQLFQQEGMVQWIFLRLGRMGVYHYRASPCWLDDTPRMEISWKQL